MTENIELWDGQMLHDNLVLPGVPRAGDEVVVGIESFIVTKVLWDVDNEKAILHAQRQPRYK